MLALVLELLAVLLPYIKDGTSELGKMVVAVVRKHREALDREIPGLVKEIEDAYRDVDHARLSQLRARLYELAGPAPASEPGDEARFEDRVRPAEPAQPQGPANPVPGAG